MLEINTPPAGIRNRIHIWIAALALVAITAACSADGQSGGQATPGGGEPQVLTVMTHDSFSASEEVIRQFEADTGIQLTFIPSGDAGAALNRAVLSREAPIADVLYGVDNTFLSRALEQDIFLPYESPALAGIPAGFRLDPQNRALPVDYGDVCLNYDKAWLAEKDLPVPQSFEELLDPRYRGLLVAENPATSSPGQAFLLATIAHFGEDAYLEYWQGLMDNGLVVVGDWDTAYYTNFSGSSGRGAQPLVVSYNSSPAAEVVFAESPLNDAPTASITLPGMCYRQVEFAGILKGTKREAAARRFIDFMLSVPFQEDMPLQMFVYPVNPQAGLPDAFTRYAVPAVQPASLAPDVIAASRDRWIQDWTRAILQ